MMLRITVTIVIYSCIFYAVYCSRVLELSDRFLEVKQDGTWFVKFYAPWCGHCKDLEPIWQQVAQDLVVTDVRVGRLDCTKFANVATEFGVRGFPTLLFIKGSRTYEYKGDRNRHDIVEFAKRLDGPSVKRIDDCLDIPTKRDKNKSFFVYFEAEKPANENKELKEAYTTIAEDFQSLAIFHVSRGDCLRDIGDITTYQTPSVYTFKDHTHFKFEFSGKDDELLNNTLYEWINKERFPVFNKISTGNFYQLLKTKKYIVMAVIEENMIGQISLKYEEFKDMLEAIAKTNRALYHKHFLFGWVGRPELANSVAMTKLTLPGIIIVNPETYQYYLPHVEENEKVPSPQSVIYLLDQILINNATAFGGDSFPLRLYRGYYEMKNTLAGMWQGNPVLTCVLFGLPLGFLSIIVYTSCCGDILEASDEDEQNTSSKQKKNE